MILQSLFPAKDGRLSAGFIAVLLIRYLKVQISAMQNNPQQSSGIFTIFTGSFCQTCGVLDYFEDLIFELDNRSPISLAVIDFEAEDEVTFQVRYRLTYQKPSCAR